MSRFWLILCLAVLMAIALVAVANSFSTPVPRAFRPSPLQRLSFHVITGALVAAVWAIGYRRQLELRRLSIRSLFVLAALQAVYRWLVRVMHPWG